MSTRTGALVLAAGFSNRFGSIKLLAPLASGDTVIAQTLARIQEAVPEVLVITRPDLADALGVPAGKLRVFEDAEKGMGASLAYGIGNVPDWDACMVCLADMPFIETGTYRELAALAAPGQIVLPHYEGRPGNPVVFGRQFYALLSRLTGDSGGRSVIREHPEQVLRQPVADPAILADIDTPEDLLRLQTRTH